MATVTKNLGVLTDAAGNQATLDIAYDDASLRVQSYTVVNGTVHTARVTARRSNGTGSTYTQDTPPGQTATIAVEQGPARRLQLTVTSSGKLDGVEYNFDLI